MSTQVTGMRKPLATRLPSALPSANLPSALPAPGSKRAAAVVGGGGLQAPKPISSGLPAPRAGNGPAIVAQVAPALSAGSRLPQAPRAHSGLLPPKPLSALSALPAVAAAAAKSAPSVPASPALVFSGSASAAASPATPATPLLPVALLVPAADEDDLAQILAAEEQSMQMQLEAASDSTVGLLDAECIAPSVDELIAELEADGSLVHLAASVPLPDVFSDNFLDDDDLAIAPTPVAQLTRRAQALAAAEEDEDDELLAAEEAGFGHFSIPEHEPLEFEQSTAGAMDCAAASSCVAPAPRSAMPAAAASTTAAATAFPFQLNTSAATVARRLVQLAAAREKMHVLHAEVDLYATKLFELSQLANSAAFSHLPLARLIAAALDGSCS